jgi:hypothetical protein
MRLAHSFAIASTSSAANAPGNRPGRRRPLGDLPLSSAEICEPRRQGEIDLRSQFFEMNLNCSEPGTDVGSYLLSEVADAKPPRTPMSRPAKKIITSMVGSEQLGKAAK